MFLTCTLSFFRLSRTGIRRKHYCVRHMCSKYRHLNTVLSITYTDWSKTSLLEPARHAAIHPHQCLPSHKDHPYTYTHTLTLWKYKYTHTAEFFYSKVWGQTFLLIFSSVSIFILKDKNQLEMVLCSHFLFHVEYDKYR